DVARHATKVARIHRTANNEFPAAYKGEGVVIGIIDTGLEYGHIAFKTQDGKDCRIKRVWNQNGYGKAPEKFGYGAEYTTRSELEAARVDSYI
ncbi:MAG: peptidase S8, partial [Muribaculaceae bacterium]|nr:peptidase S8 [Muribaculaceae bacterium]